MTRFKKILAVGAAVLAISVMSLTAFAATGTTPAEIVSGLTGKTLDQVAAERAASGKTYGAIADEAGKLDEFKQQMLELKKAQLKEKVDAGILTQERANEILAAIEKNQASCDGTGSGGIGRMMGAGFGKMNGGCHGSGQGAGRGQGNGGGFCLAR